MSKIIKCSICGEDIAANAKMCPKCGAKNKKPIYKRWWIWVIAILIISAVFSGRNDSKTQKVDSDKNFASQNETMYNIGDMVKTDKFEINISSVETSKIVGSTYLKTEPSEGGIYIIVNWEYKNISDSPISAFSVPSIKISDNNGVKYDSDLNATSYYATQVQLDSKIVSDLNPNIKVKDAEVFEISEEAYKKGGFKVKVDADRDFEVNIN